MMSLGHLKSVNRSVLFNEKLLKHSLDSYWKIHQISMHNLKECFYLCDFNTFQCIENEALSRVDSDVNVNETYSICIVSGYGSLIMSLPTLSDY